MGGLKVRLFLYPRGVIVAKTYEIDSRETFLNFVAKMSQYFTLRDEKKLPFQKINITCKKWRKLKSSKQHRCYWRCIGELKKAFIKNGHDTNEEEVHEFVKKNSGFTRSLMGTMVTLSVSDSSDDATSNELNRLIDFIQRFAAEEFGHNIEVG